MSFFYDHPDFPSIPREEIRSFWWSNQPVEHACGHWVEYGFALREPMPIPPTDHKLWLVMMTMSAAAEYHIYPCMWCGAVFGPKAPENHVVMDINCPLVAQQWASRTSGPIRPPSGEVIELRDFEEHQ